MRNLIIIFILISFNASAFGQCEYSNPTSGLGIGLLGYNTESERPFIFEAFNDRNLSDQFCSWDIYDYETPSPFCAKFHKPDYGIVQVVVLDSVEEAYKVLVNEKDIKYVPKSPNYIFWTWEEYLKKSHGIRRRIENNDFKNQPIKEKPNDLSETVQIPDDKHELFCVLEVKGDWIKVKYDCFYNSPKNPNEGMPCSAYITDCPSSATGWLRWRIGNRITVDIFLMA
ncbi:hypothetical protein QYS48_05205 [Marivirga arenosa]|uniref:Uncharacterized protein n=1 Tax=Marivirga arenosa TaxID=3059076 RepID=A0AA49GID7_9BACT|nr:hypothetical protein [Marivirga sp. ABR2-2]WKK86364.1 hypothetical protein QYS48_05205 [Marivirga sp. ABR2-2]